MICEKRHRYDPQHNNLPDDQSGAGRYRCAGCAYEKGYKDGLGGRGNLIAEIKTVVPKELSEKEKALFTELQHISTFNPRAM